MSTKLYLLDLRTYQNGMWRSLMNELPEDRQARVLACRFDPDRARIAGGGWLLRHALEQNGIPAAQQRFSKNPWGKPELQNGPHFSLSHGGLLAVCATSDHPIGVDAELPRCTMAIARRYFRPEELEGLDLQPSFAQMNSLNRIWTAKEAFTKALGQGTAMPLNSFTVRLSADGAVLEQDLSTLPYRLHEYQEGPCRICLCTTDDKPELEYVTK